MAVIDASFISLDKVLPAVIRLISKDGIIVALVKPQFEVGKGEVGKGGVVRDTAKHQRVIEEVAAEAVCLGLTVLGVTESPITGPKGNREFLMVMARQ